MELVTDYKIGPVQWAVSKNIIFGEELWEMSRKIENVGRKCKFGNDKENQKMGGKFPSHIHPDFPPKSGISDPFPISRSLCRVLIITTHPHSIFARATRVARRVARVENTTPH
jgi:hypothetical protein